VSALSSSEEGLLSTSDQIQFVFFWITCQVKFKNHEDLRLVWARGTMNLKLGAFDYQNGKRILTVANEIKLMHRFGYV